MKNKFTKCRVLGNKIPIVINFGRMPLANGFSKSKKKQTTFSMKAAFNKKNGLFQLVDVPPEKKMFNSNYLFLSSTSIRMKKHFKDLSKKIKKSFLSRKDLILEIGCNDGIFLENFKNYDHIGIEPSKNVSDIARNKKIKIINKFFNFETLLNNKLLHAAKVIYAANVICHIPNIKDLFQNISFSLKDNGVFIFEEPYLGDLIEKTSYDQIYDEHCYIFSIQSVSNIAQLFNLEVFHAERISTHGGSMRYYICHKSIKKKTNLLKKLIYYEKQDKLGSLETIKIFAKKCQISKKNLKNKIKNITKNKKVKIYGYGATSKSTTILNYCKINNNQIVAIFDNSKTKINKYTPNTGIKIINYKLFNKIKPRYCFLFAWNHYEEIFSKENNNIVWITHIDKKFFPKKYHGRIL